VQTFANAIRPEGVAWRRPPKHVNIHPQFFQFVYNAKTPNDGTVEKLILDPDPDEFQNLIEYVPYSVRPIRRPTFPKV